MTDHTIHDSLPSGFAYADASQASEYAASGFVSGAMKVCFVRAADDVIHDEADLLQIGGPDEFPRGYYEHLATRNTARLVVRLRPPFKVEQVSRRALIANNMLSLGILPGEAVDWYVREYNNGWQAARRSGDLDRSDTSHAWDDGWLDANAVRPKWHLTWCLDHDQCGEA